jgi:hypothetical protein
MDKVEIDAPWTNGKEEIEPSRLLFLQQTKKQLLYFQKQNDTEYIRNDIAGYDLIIKSKSEKNAENFLKIKRDAILEGKRFKDNLEVIKQMKKLKLWEKN